MASKEAKRRHNARRNQRKRAKAGARAAAIANHKTKVHYANLRLAMQALRVIPDAAIESDYPLVVYECPICHKLLIGIRRHDIILP